MVDSENNPGPFSYPRSGYDCFRLAIHPRVSHLRGDDGGCRSFRRSRATSKGAQDPAALLYLRRSVFRYCSCGRILKTPASDEHWRSMVL